MLSERILFPILLVALTGFTFGWFFQVSDGYGFIVYFFLVVIAALAVFPFFARRAAGALTSQLYFVALLAKFAASAARYWMITDLYGRGDALLYDRGGKVIAEILRLGDYSIIDQWRTGTTSLQYLAGFLYTVLPESLEGVFLLFSFFAFLGSLFFLLAFRTAFPKKDPTAYAALVLFLPSILFWPASLGKDATTFFGFGIVAYGVALLWVKHAPQGLIWMAAGVAPVFMVRPHMVGFFVITAGVAAVWSLFGSMRGVLIRVAGIVLVCALGYYVLQFNAELLFGSELEEVSTTKIVDLYETRQRSTRTGKSKFTLPEATVVLAPVYVVGTVLFRPFPWEANNPAMALTALENLFFLWLFIKRRKVFWENLKLTRLNMLLALCLFFSLGVMAYQSGTSNLGIIARQRVQFLPYLFMLFM